MTPRRVFTRKAKTFHFVAGGDVDWKKTHQLLIRKDGRFPGVIERKSRK